MTTNICNIKVIVSFHDTDVQSVTFQELDPLTTMDYVYYYVYTVHGLPTIRYSVRSL